MVAAAAILPQGLVVRIGHLPLVGASRVWPTTSGCATGRPRLLPRALDLLAEALVLRLQLGGVLLAEVLGLEDRADLERGLLAGHGIGAAPDPLDRLLHRLDLPQPEPGD